MPFLGLPLIFFSFLTFLMNFLISLVEFPRTSFKETATCTGLAILFPYINCFHLPPERPTMPSILTPESPGRTPAKGFPAEGSLGIASVP